MAKITCTIRNVSQGGGRFSWPWRAEGANKPFYSTFRSAGGGRFMPAALVFLPASLFLAASGGGVCYADESGSDSLSALQATVSAQEAKLKKEELQLEQQSLELDQQQRLLDGEMAQLRGTGTGGTTQTAADTSAPSGGAAGGGGAQQSSPDGTVGQQQQQQQQQQNQQQTKVILQSSAVLSNAGGVLTPKGQFVIDPSIEYDYWSQNQLQLNGFTIIPGITLGNIFISRVDQNFMTAAVTARYGITDRLEVNLKVPVVAGYGTLAAQQVGATAQPVVANSSNVNIGDVQLGASYQFNSGENGWPVFVGNLLFKTATGVSPYQVPIYTVNDPNGAYLQGVAKRLPTGTGFYALEPSLTVFYPTAPGVLFGNLQYIENFSRSFNIPSPAGGAAIHENLSPGSAVAATFGLGFALNDKASMTFSYQEEHVFGSSANGQSLAGSSYDFGTFNFGLGYTISPTTSVNLGVGIGAGPNAPVAKILVEVPIRFNGL